MEIIRCNHCGRDHRSDFCISTGKVPSYDCPECDINPNDFNDGTETEMIKEFDNHDTKHTNSTENEHIFVS